MWLEEPVAKLTFVGEVHQDNNRLMVGNKDVVREFVSAWGGRCQVGILEISLQLLPRSDVRVGCGGGLSTCGE